MAAQDQRPRFYESQYLGADDMNAVVEYGHVQLARHELGAHTAGIAIGLYLIESPTAGAPERRNVTLVPGLAIDGFSRQIVALSRALLPESLFTGIAFDANVDDPAQNNGTPPGRFVRVWIEYDETNAKSPPPGFERCDAGDNYARVQESYRFVVGDRPALADRRSPLSIAGQSIDAERGLQAFDMTAGLLKDASIPQQQFPADNSRARWLVPIGYVRWVAYQQGGGYFVNRNIDPADKGDDRIRKFRQYIGLPTENIHAVDGAVVLRNRADKPDDPGRFQARLQSGDPIADTRRDLVWVEGNLRVVGDVRLAAGAIRFADINGTDQNTPLSIERTGDRPAVVGGRALDALIGPDAQPTNRFAVATVLVDDPDPSKRQLSEKLTVLSGGSIGVSNDSPQRKLHVKGDAIRLDSPDGTKTVELRTDGAQVDLSTTTNDLYLRSASGAPPHNIVMNPDVGDGNVGIGTASPAYKLDVKATAIKLGLEDAGGGQLILKNNPGDNRIFLEAFDAAGTGSATEMLLTGKDSDNAPLITIRADTTNIEGDLNVRGSFGDQATVGGEGLGGVVFGTTNAGVLHADMRNLAVGFGTGNPSAWLNVFCRTVHELSDERAKTNIRPIADALTQVARLRGVAFEWKGDAAAGQPKGSLGLIAQEVQEVVPEAVTIRGHGAGLSYSALVPLLIEAVKELKRETEQLKAELGEQHQRMEALERQRGSARPPPKRAARPSDKKQT
jgi:Chaperone of endosialidase